MNSKSGKDEVKQAAIRERELLLGATGVLNDADAVEESAILGDDDALDDADWEKRYKALGRG
ncbi:hypothetical protein [Paracoccus sp. (in: a-proteobacteria)]|uniref:hypothetical protein n=1 Tax=Paracoccus sp. TaxID=267 RepID=UPI002896D073|nr:hypothetical protein [Paracoccus sp. (in: a-proteobacteria)]